MERDHERVTRRTLPQVTVGIPLSLLKRIDDRVAETSAKSRSAWIVGLIKAALGDETDEEATS